MQFNVILNSSTGMWEVWPYSGGMYANEHIGAFATQQHANDVGNAYINGFADGVWHGGGETQESAAKAERIRSKGVQP